MNINHRIFSISLVAALGMVLMLVIGWQSFSTIESSLQQVLVSSVDHAASTESHGDLTDEEVQALLGAASFARMKLVVLTILSLGALVGLSFWIGRSISGRIHKIAEQVTEIAEQRDLATRLDDTSRDEIGMFAKSFNMFSEQIYQTVSSAGQTAQEVAGAATELSATSEEMTMTMGQQSTQIEQIVSSVLQMGDSVTDVAQKASGASQNAEQAGEVATSGGEVVRDTILRMQAIDEAVSASALAVRELGKRGEKIGEVILVINDIAEQTNLLALNAAIEAARAGEHGRGFAVVADEVRKLADRTTNATEEIAESIKAIQTETAQAVDRMNTGTEQVRDGVSRAQEAGEALGQIVGNTNEVAKMVEAIASATEEQTASSAEINQAVDSVQASTRESTEAAEQSSQAVHQLSLQAEQLQRMISEFRLSAA